MTQIFTSTGRGGKTEKPIGFDQRPKVQTLCPVGFGPSKPPAALPDRQPEMAPQELVRVRDDELDPAQFDPETGEFNKPQPEPLRRHRADATTWVDTALAARRG